MAKSINQVILMGRLTRDPELRVTGTGKNVVSASLAVDKFGKTEQTNYFDLVAWDKTAELIEKYLSKGSKILVQGYLDHRTWEQDGNKRSKVDVIVNDVTFLDSNENTSKAPEPKQDSPIDLSDIPF